MNNIGKIVYKKLYKINLIKYFQNIKEEQGQTLDFYLKKFKL